MSYERQPSHPIDAARMGRCHAQDMALRWYELANAGPTTVERIFEAADLFCEDVDDYVSKNVAANPHQPQTGANNGGGVPASPGLAPSPGIPQPKHRGPAPEDKRISEGKGKRAWAIQKAHNFTDNEKRLLNDHFGIQDFNVLHFQDYDLYIEFCERKHQLPDPSAQDVPVPAV